MSVTIASPPVRMSIAVSLGLVTLLGPSSIDMYLPSMPEMAVDLGTSYPGMQLTLTVFLLAMGLGQLLFGPVIDAFGRRVPLVCGIVAFVLSAIWSSLSPSIEMLLLARFVQGLAASLALVVAMSSVRDVAEGVRATQLFAMLMTIQGLAPVLAPALGGVIGAQFGWRAVFVTMGLIGIVVLLNALLNLPETLPRDRREPLRLKSVLRTYGQIISEPQFLVPGLALGGVFFFLFSYLSGASLVYQQGYGLTPDMFGMVFGGTGIAVLFGAISSARLVTALRVELLSVAGVAMIFIGAVLAVVSGMTGIGLYGVVAGMFMAMFGLGIAEATLMSIALSSRQTALGSSAALLGAFPFVLGSLATPVAGSIAERDANLWLAFLAVAALSVLVLALVNARMVARSGRTVTMQH